jgi:Flp pilus assembly protein TadB
LSYEPTGKEASMIGAALALIVIGIVFLFIVPWVGIVVGIVGVILFVLFLLGFGRRAAEGRP